MQTLLQIQNVCLNMSILKVTSSGIPKGAQSSPSDDTSWELRLLDFLFFMLLSALLPKAFALQCCICLYDSGSSQTRGDHISPMVS